MSATGQIALPLGWPKPRREEPFIVTPANARAARLLGSPGDWPGRAALLVGPRKSGRSLLARIFAGRTGGTVIDDAMRAPEEHLFHAWNRAQAAQRPLLLVADAAPPTWQVRLPDLRSRLSASLVAEIDPPDDELVRALLDQQMARCGLDARPELVDWLVARLERSYTAILGAVELLDQQVLETHKRLTVPFARATLVAAGLIGFSEPE